MKYEIKHRWTGATLFVSDAECPSLKVCIEAAVKARANLADANLADANLARANLARANLARADLARANLADANLARADLARANLADANLARANLARANLADADLADADLTGADLTGADLTYANLTGANLTYANLTGAVLTRAVLTRADLTGAVLRDADLTPVRDDFFAVLSSSPAEVPALISALREGRVDGSTYSGPCACLVGTLANARGCDCTSIPGLAPNANRPAESFFTAIRKGDTPETNAAAKIALEWAEEWLSRMKAAFGVVGGAS